MFTNVWMLLYITLCSGCMHQLLNVKCELGVCMYVRLCVWMSYSLFVYSVSATDWMSTVVVSKERERVSESVFVCVTVSVCMWRPSLSLTPGPPYPPSAPHPLPLRLPAASWKLWSSTWPLWRARRPRTSPQTPGTPATGRGCSTLALCQPSS